MGDSNKLDPKIQVGIDEYLRGRIASAWKIAVAVAGLFGVSSVIAIWQGAKVVSKELTPGLVKTEVETSIAAYCVEFDRSLDLAKRHAVEIDSLSTQAGKTHGGIEEEAERLSARADELREQWSSTGGEIKREGIAALEDVAKMQEQAEEKLKTSGEDAVIDIERRVWELNSRLAPLNGEVAQAADDLASIRERIDTLAKPAEEGNQHEGDVLWLVSDVAELLTEPESEFGKKLLDELRQQGSSEFVSLKESTETLHRAIVEIPRLPVGTIVPYSGPEIPDGWLACDGSPIDREQYPELARILDVRFDPDGQRIRLPDMQGRFPIGAGKGVGLDAYDLGVRGGSEETKLTERELPSHSHGTTVSIDKAGSHRHAITAPAASDDGGNNDTHFAVGDEKDGRRLPNVDVSPAGDHTHRGSVKVSPSGEGKAFSNVPPFLAVTYIIKT